MIVEENALRYYKLPDEIGESCMLRIIIAQLIFDMRLYFCRNNSWNSGNCFTCHSSSNSYPKTNLPKNYALKY